MKADETLSKSELNGINEDDKVMGKMRTRVWNSAAADFIILEAI